MARLNSDKPAMDEHLIQLFDCYREALQSEPTIQQLHEIRDQLDSWLLGENLARQLAVINDPDRIARLRDSATRLMRAAEDLSSKRQDSRDFVRTGGLTLGVGMMGGALAGVAALTFPALAILPFAGGVYIAWRAKSQSAKNSGEINLLNQIAGRLAGLLKE
jgi:hypothetical protein